jgi:hypothetical protein
MGHDVCLWHIADVPLALTNVCFEGKNGHDAGVTPFPLMTQSGHSEADQNGTGLGAAGVVLAVSPKRPS